MRQPLVVGNWKMHGSTQFVEALLGDLLNYEQGGSVEIAVCPTFVHLAQAVVQVVDSAIWVGAQDCGHAHAGAFTGEVSATSLVDIGCRWVIVGHSERRAYHGESDSLIANKLAAAIDAGLRPILCVGETQQQRESGDAQLVVAQQLQGALAELSDVSGLVVAYEPVWAIGTGLTATPDQAQVMHAFIRAQLADYQKIDAASTRLLYGGSVKADNAAQLFGQADIDGALVGGAALAAKDFQAIINAAA